MILAIDALNNVINLSRRGAAQLHNIAENTLRARMAGAVSKTDYRPIQQIMTKE